MNLRTLTAVLAGSHITAAKHWRDLNLKTDPGTNLHHFARQRMRANALAWREARRALELEGEAARFDHNFKRARGER